MIDKKKEEKNQNVFNYIFDLEMSVLFYHVYRKTDYVCFQTMQL